MMKKQHDILLLRILKLLYLEFGYFFLRGFGSYVGCLSPTAKFSQTRAYFLTCSPYKPLSHLKFPIVVNDSILLPASYVPNLVSSFPSIILSRKSPVLRILAL